MPETAWLLFGAAALLLIQFQIWWLDRNIRRLAELMRQGFFEVQLRCEKAQVIAEIRERAAMRIEK